MQRETTEQYTPTQSSPVNRNLVSLDDFRDSAKRRSIEPNALVDLGEFNFHLQIDDPSALRPLKVDETARFSVSKEQAQHLDCGDIQELFRHWMEPIQTAISNWQKDSAAAAHSPEKNANAAENNGHGPVQGQHESGRHPETNRPRDVHGRPESGHPLEQGSASLDAERVSLREAALANIPDINNNIGRNRRDFFESNMRAFEKRAREVGLSDGEVADTYRQVQRLLTAEDTSNARPRAERLRIAEQVMYHAANPANIDQGNLTCNVTTVEDRMFRTKPSRAAEVIATTALTGQWVAPDGKVIRIDPRSLEPNRDEQMDVPGDNKRSEASKMFQIATLNDVGQRFAHPLYFEQRAHGSDTEVGGYWADSQGRFAKEFVGVNSQGITQVSQRLDGTSSPFVMMNSRVPRDHSGLISFSSAAQLGQELERTDFKRSPAVLVVNAFDPIFTVHHPQIGVKVNHVVSITDYDPATQRVYIDDQHGRRRDQWVQLSDLYRATI